MFDLVGDTGPMDQFSENAGNAGDRMVECFRRAFKLVMEHFLAEHRLRQLRGRPGIIQRHGQAGLAGSFAYVVQGDTINTLQASVFSTSRYARVHEFGATIVPKRAKYLRFQLPDGQWRSAAKVRIPPRLGFRKVWKETETDRGKILTRCTDEVADALFKGVR